MDDDGYYFVEEVGYNKFIFEVKVFEGWMEVIFNNIEMIVYDGIYMEKWGVFENYFKVGNYLVIIEEGVFFKVKYYDLEISY